MDVAKDFTSVYPEDDRQSSLVNWSSGYLTELDGSMDKTVWRNGIISARQLE